MIKWITETKFDSLTLIEVTTNEALAVTGEKKRVCCISPRTHCYWSQTNQPSLH